MSADLLTRARSAVTRDDECSAIRAAVCHFINDAAAALPLIDIIVAVRSGRAPRACLFGIAAALVPEGWRWVKTATGAGPAEGRRIGVYMPARHDKELHSEVVWSEGGGTDALALLIAIMEAGNVEA